jgi:hypothetical protein
LKVTKTKPKKHPILIEKAEVAKELFGGRCFWCGKPYGKGFSFHHLRYPPGELTYSDFNGTVNYHKYILPKVEKEPERFALLCRAHHHFVEILTSIKDEKKWIRAFLLIMCTDGVKGGESTPSNLTAISLENAKAVKSYVLNPNSTLKKLLSRHCNIDSMFGELGIDSY